jgi:hypothetical protein
MPKLKNILQDLGSAVVPAATTLGFSALTGGTGAALSLPSLLAAAGAASGGFARNEEQERLRKMMRLQAEEDRRAQSMANLINALQPGAGARARPAKIEIPKKGFGETIAGGVSGGIQAYQLAQSAKEALEDRILRRKLLENKGSPTPWRGPIGTMGGAPGGATGGTSDLHKTITKIAQYGPEGGSILPTENMPISETGTLYADIPMPGEEFISTGGGMERYVGKASRPLGDITTKQFFSQPHLAPAYGEGISKRAKENLTRATAAAASQQERLNVFIQNVGNKLAYDNVLQDDVNDEALKIFMEMGLGDAKDFESIRGSIVPSWRTYRQERAKADREILDGVLKLAGEAYDGPTVVGAVELYLSQANRQNINLTESEAKTAVSSIIAKAQDLKLSAENKQKFAGYTYIDASLMSVQDHIRSILPDPSTFTVGLRDGFAKTLSGATYNKDRHNKFNDDWGIIRGRITDLKAQIGKATLTDDVAEALSRVGFTVEFAGRVFSGAQVRPDEAELLRNIFIGGFTSTPERVLRDTDLFREQLKNMRLALVSAGMGASTGNVYAYLTNDHLASLVERDDPIAIQELQARENRLRERLGRDPTPDDVKNYAWGTMAGSVSAEEMLEQVQARTNLGRFKLHPNPK